MSVISPQFFVFTAFALLVYWLFPRRRRWHVLLFFSLCFIAANTGIRPKLTALFLGEVLLTWFAAYMQARADSERLKTWLTRGTVALLIAALVFCKDMSFFTETAGIVGGWFGSGKAPRAPAIPAPYGVSYYTLILIGYLLDVRWGTVEAPQKNPLKVLTFVSFFPQLPSGPFSRYSETAPALFDGADWDLRRAAFGVQRILWGLFKKLVLAERLSLMVAAIYDAQPARAGLVVALGAFLYVAQIYTDFGGCMDIVIGVAELFGVKLAENFARPFAAGDLSSLWRRWHITLGLWLKDYLFYPVQRSRWMASIRRGAKSRWGKKASRDIPTYIAMFITWFCVGFWHGGHWSLICANGLFFFVMIAGGMLLQPAFDRLTKLLRLDTQAWSFGFFQRVRSCCLFCFSISLGRHSSLGAGFRAWKTVFTEFDPWVLADGTLFELGLDRQDVGVLLAGLAVLLIVSMLQEKHGSLRELIARQNLPFRWLVYLSLFLAVCIFGCYGPGYNPADFIYMQF